MDLIETKLDLLEDRLQEMVTLVQNQVTKSKEALLNKDKNLADEVIARDEEVDSMEMKINQNCEQILALYNPVAIDLRLILAAIRICLNLERMGDHAEGVCHLVNEIKDEIDSIYLDAFQLEEMFDTAIVMLDDIFLAMKNKDIHLAKSINKKDRFLNKAYRKSVSIAAKLIKENVKETKTVLQLLSIVRKVERMGDLSKNMSEEIIFHLSGKFPKRKSKRRKKNPDQ